MEVAANLSLSLTQFFPSVELQKFNLNPVHCPQSPVCFPTIKFFLQNSSAVAQVPASQGTFNAELQPYLRCSMPHKRLRVAVLLSGGVDSSVALRLLHAAGHSCSAFYLKIWFQEDLKTSGQNAHGKRI